MSRETLGEKLALRRKANPEGTWSLIRWPKGFVEGEENRLFVASCGAWRGYFMLAPDALYNDRDPGAPFTLLFDTRSWTPIPTSSVKPFRGFTYRVPAVLSEQVPEDYPPSHRSRDHRH